MSDGAADEEEVDCAAGEGLPAAEAADRVLPLQGLLVDGHNLLAAQEPLDHFLLWMIINVSKVTLLAQQSNGSLHLCQRIASAVIVMIIGMII